MFIIKNGTGFQFGSGFESWAKLFQGSRLSHNEPSVLLDHWCKISKF